MIISLAPWPKFKRLSMKDGVIRRRIAILLAALNTSQKKENETMEEFNKKFNDLVKSLPTTIKPPDASILIHYMEAFEGEIRYQLRDKDPQTLRDAQNYVKDR
jgi:hypothetical protein